MSREQPTELAVVRHGQTEFNVRGLYQGHTDSPLTDEGVAQARLLAPRLHSLGCSPTIYCSDLGRARHTAVPSRRSPGTCSVCPKTHRAG